VAQKFTTPITIRDLSSASSDSIAVSLSGDTNDRFKIEAGGRIVWGTGLAAGDVNLYRDSANALKTDDTFEAASGLITLTTSGAPVASIADGALAVDTTNDIFYVRSGGAWVQVSGTGGVTDHGALSGLGDDDHTIYLLADGTRAATELTISGDLTVDTDTLYVDSANNRVGIGTTTPSTTFDVDGTLTATSLVGPLTGNASTASALQTARTIELTGDVTGSASFDGSADITISATVSAEITDIDSLSDVTITSAADGQLLIYNGTEWVNDTLPTSEPMGHEDRTASTISFNSGTRVLSIAPVSSSHTVWCAGVRYVKTTTETVTLPNTPALYYIYYDTSGVLQYQTSYFTWHEDTPTAYLYWNGTDYLLFDERHGITLDWATHEYLHRTRGAVIANGFGASSYVDDGDGSSNSHAQIDIADGTFFDEDLEINILHSASPTANTFEQILQGAAEIPVLYLSGAVWTFDSATEYPLKQGSSLATYNLDTAGTWSTPDLGNSKFGISWVAATNILGSPIVAILGQAEYNNVGEAEAARWEDLNLTGFPVVEMRPLYKVVYQTATSYANTPKAAIRGVYDLRRLGAGSSSIPAFPVSDHGSLTGLSDDDHTQYFNVARHDAHDHSTAMSTVVFGDISDVDMTSLAPSAGDLAYFDGSNWVPYPFTIQNSGGVSTSSETLGDILLFDGTNYVNTPHTLSNVTDVTISSAASGDFLKWNGSVWVNDPINLSTDTVGDYVASLVAGTGITLSNNSGEGATPTIEIGQAVGTTDSVTFNDVTVSGNLTVSGSTTTVDTATLSVEDPLIILASGNNAADVVDIGFYGLYDTSGSQDLYAGLFRDATDGKFKLFKDSQSAPTTTVDTGASGYSVADLVANVEGNLTGTADSANTLSTPRTISLSGDVVGSVSFDGSANVSISTTIQADSVALGTDTTGDYVESLVAGTGVTLSNNTGEGATPTVAIGQAVAASDDVTFNTVTGTNGVVTLTTAGTPTATIADGAIAVDTTNDLLYFRSGSTWQQVTGGGGASVTVSDGAPSSPSSGDLWYESDTGSMFVYYDDGDTQQWVEVGGSSVVAMTVSDTPPSTPSNGDMWFESDTGKTYVYYTDGTSSQWVEVGAAASAAAYVEVSDTAPSAPDNGTLWYDSATSALLVYYNDGSSAQWIEVIGDSVVAMTTSDTAPSSPTNGDLWFESDTGRTYLYYDDGTSGQWVEVGAAGGVASTVATSQPATANTGDIWYDSDDAELFIYNGSTWVSAGGGASVTVSDTDPAGPSEGDMWFESDTGRLLVYYDSSWVEVGGTGSVNPTITSSSTDAAILLMEIGP
jgi:hypothetical protein